MSFGTPASGTLKDYLSKVTEVTVGTKTYKKSSYSSLYSSDQYTWKLTDSSSLWGSNYDVIDLTTDGFVGEKVTITLKADGYNDLVYQAETDGEKGPDQVKTMDITSFSHIDNGYLIGFSETNRTVLKTYLQNITDVKVGNDFYEFASFSFFYGDGYYMLYTVDDSQSNSDFDHLKISASGFNNTETGATTVIVISSEGYEDATFTVVYTGSGFVLSDSAAAEKLLASLVQLPVTDVLLPAQATELPKFDIILPEVTEEVTEDTTDVTEDTEDKANETEEAENADESSEAEKSKSEEEEITETPETEETEKEDFSEDQVEEAEEVETETDGEVSAETEEAAAE